MLTRRGFLKGIASGAVAGLSLCGYAFAVEPYRLLTTHYAITPPLWPRTLRLRIAMIADLHACEPWMRLDQIAAIVDRTNDLKPDLVVLLGDFESRNRFVQRPVPRAEWARLLAGLKAPLGVHAVLGNHDWWDDWDAMARGGGPVVNRVALERAGIPVYENDAVRLVKDGEPFWLAGLGDQWAFWDRSPEHRRRFPHLWYEGVDDMQALLGRIGSDGPAILLAHEPDVFAEVPDRFALQLSGHTHGGQVQFFGYAPKVPSRFGQRYVYGNIVENDRHLVVSGGLGCSVAPIRFGRPPEVVVVELGDVSSSVGAGA
ncbi:MAG: metallophosphoesterase [Hyphomicrobiaceae bacterium]